MTLVAYQVRIEYPSGRHEDTTISGGESFALAKDAFMRTQVALAPFDWRGAVAFVKGAVPAEEAQARRTMLAWERGEGNGHVHDGRRYGLAFTRAAS